MHDFRVPVVSAEPAARRGRAISVAHAQPVAAVAALLVLVWALAHGFWPIWPLWTIAGLLVFGLVAGPGARLAGAGQHTRWPSPPPRSRCCCF